MYSKIRILLLFLSLRSGPLWYRLPFSNIWFSPYLSQVHIFNILFPVQEINRLHFLFSQLWSWSSANSTMYIHYPYPNSHITAFVSPVLESLLQINVKMCRYRSPCRNRIVNRICRLYSNSANAAFKSVSKIRRERSNNHVKKFSWFRLVVLCKGEKGCIIDQRKCLWTRERRVRRNDGLNP